MIDVNFTKQNTSSRGFTIVELLIVVVVIAILAAITIIAYNGITRQAAESSVKSDLQNSAKQIEVVKESAGTGTYPATSAEATLAQSPGNTVTYVKKPYGYCISGINPKTNKTFAIRSANKIITEGNCDVAVSTFAGTGVSGYAEGAGTVAQFTYPNGIASDADGTLYVSDSQNNRIRKITTDGTVSLLAGSGVSGAANGTGASASFNTPGKLTVDSQGNLYVVESSRNTVRKIDTKTGVVSSFAGVSATCNYGRGPYADGSTSVARLDGPNAIVSDSSGVFYIAESRSMRIRAVQPNGDVSTYAGSGDIKLCNASSADAGYTDGNRLSAAFGSIQDIIIGKDDTLYIADTTNNAIRTINKAGVVSTLPTSYTLQQTPKVLIIDSNGTVYSATNTAVYSLSPTGTVSLVAGSTAWGFVNGSATTSRFYGINDITFSPDETAIFVADMNNNRIRKISL